MTNFRRDDAITVMGTEVEKAHSVLYGCIVSNDANSNEVQFVIFCALRELIKYYLVWEYR
jgi:hypothetical protein